MTKLPKYPAYKGSKAPSPKVVQSPCHVANSTAGIRKQMVQHVKSVEGYTRSMLKNLSPEEIQEAIQRLRNEVVTDKRC